MQRVVDIYFFLLYLLFILELVLFTAGPRFTNKSSGPVQFQNQSKVRSFSNHTERTSIIIIYVLEVTVGLPQLQESV